MKRTGLFVSVALVGVCAFVLVGCSGATSGKASSSAAEGQSSAAVQAEIEEGQAGVGTSLPADDFEMVAEDYATAYQVSSEKMDIIVQDFEAYAAGLSEDEKNTPEFYERYENARFDLFDAADAGIRTMEKLKEADGNEEDFKTYQGQLDQKFFDLQMQLEAAW